jgi:hypothetical protein
MGLHPRLSFDFMSLNTGVLQRGVGSLALVQGEPGWSGPRGERKKGEVGHVEDSARK